MAYYRVCPHCGANIDRGERCDCRREQARKDLISAVLQMSAEDRAELLELWKQKKAALDARNIQDGRAQQVLTDSVDAFSLQEDKRKCN